MMIELYKNFQVEPLLCIPKYMPSIMFNFKDYMFCPEIYGQRGMLYVFNDFQINFFFYSTREWLYNYEDENVFGVFDCTLIHDQIFVYDTLFYLDTPFRNRLEFCSNFVIQNGERIFNRTKYKLFLVNYFPLQKGSLDVVEYLKLWMEFTRDTFQHLKFLGIYIKHNQHRFFFPSLKYSFGYYKVGFKPSHIFLTLFIDSNYELYVFDDRNSKNTIFRLKYPFFDDNTGSNDSEFYISNYLSFKYLDHEFQYDKEDMLHNPNSFKNVCQNSNNFFESLKNSRRNFIIKLEDDRLSLELMLDNNQKPIEILNHIPITSKNVALHKYHMLNKNFELKDLYFPTKYTTYDQEYPDPAFPATHMKNRWDFEYTKNYPWLPKSKLRSFLHLFSNCLFKKLLDFVTFDPNQFDPEKNDPNIEHSEGYFQSKLASIKLLKAQKGDDDAPLGQEEPLRGDDDKDSKIKMILKDPPSSSMKIKYVPLENFDWIQCIKLQYQHTFPFLAPNYRPDEKEYLMNYYIFENNLQLKLDLQKIMTQMNFETKYNSLEYVFVSKKNHEKNRIKKFCHAVISEDIPINQLNRNKSRWMKKYNKYYPQQKQHHDFLNYNILCYSKFLVSENKQYSRSTFKHVFLNQKSYKSWNIQITCSLLFENWEILIYKKPDANDQKNTTTIIIDQQKIEELNQILFEYFQGVF